MDDTEHSRTYKTLFIKYLKMIKEVDNLIAESKYCFDDKAINDYLVPLRIWYKKCLHFYDEEHLIHDKNWEGRENFGRKIPEQDETV